MWSQRYPDDETPVTGVYRRNCDRSIRVLACASGARGRASVISYQRSPSGIRGKLYDHLDGDDNEDRLSETTEGAVDACEGAGSAFRE